MRGKPVIPRTPLGDAYCQCFDKDPPGTQVFTVQGLSVTVTTPGVTVSNSFAYDAVATCDTTHLYIRDRQPNGELDSARTFPLVESTISIGSIAEKPVLPPDQPDLQMIRLVLLGHARYVKTIE